MIKQTKINELDRLVRQLRCNYPDYSSGFSECENKDGNLARGGGLCVECCVKGIAELSNEYSAWRLNANIRRAAAYYSDIKKGIKDGS